MAETKLDADAKALANDWARALWSRNVETESTADILGPLIAKLVAHVRADRVDLDSLRKTVALNRGQSAEVLAAGVLAWCDAVSARSS